MSHLSAFTENNPKLRTLLAQVPELEDQIHLLNETLSEDSPLSTANRDWVFWACLHALRDPELLVWAKQQFPAPCADTQKGVLLASSRMAVTNPYFMARNIQPLQAGGSLDSLEMRPFSALDVSDACGYHYACVAISAVNGGFVCYNSHLHSLKTSGESDAAIDQALRLVAALCSLRQIFFNAASLTDKA